MSSNLQGFLQKFNSAEGLLADTIDPLNTFDVQFYFWPCIDPKNEPPGPWSLENIKNKTQVALVNGVSNIANNAFGGLLGQIMALTNDSVINLRNEYLTDKNNGQMTLIDYISRGHKINDITSNGDLGQQLGNAIGMSRKEGTTDQLVLDLSYYIQNAQLPAITTQDGGTAETLYGDFPITGRYVKPQSNNFSLNILNTKAPLMERIFYPWMREVSLPVWSYDKQPYTTADVRIGFEKHADVAYRFVNARPSNIDTYQPSNESNSSITRQVTFIFDYLFVESELKTQQSIGDTAIELFKSVGGGAAGIMGM